MNNQEFLFYFKSILYINFFNFSRTSIDYHIFRSYYLLKSNHLYISIVVDHYSHISRLYILSHFNILYIRVNIFSIFLNFMLNNTLLCKCYKVVVFYFHLYINYKNFLTNILSNLRYIFNKFNCCL